MAVQSVAPGRFEQVRTFLNTWELPHATRTPVDRLPDLLADRLGWGAALPDVPAARGRDLEELVELRTALRGVLGQPVPSGLSEWLDRHPIVVTIGPEQPVTYVPREPGPVSALLALVVDGVAQRQWARLKSCPDCKHVFYDHSRNGTRVWCGMYAGTPDGRACGSIAKVRSYRARQRTSAGDPPPPP